MTPTVGWLALAAAGIAILVVGVVTATRPSSPPPQTSAERGQMWQRLHGAPDVDPDSVPIVRLFLAVTHAMASPFARAGVLPDVLTVAGVWMAALVTLCGWEGGRWCLVGGVVVIISALTDGVDGAVAGFTDRSTARGYVLDSVADRITEVLFFTAIVLGGGATGTSIAAMASVMLLEYTRARAVSSRGHGSGVGPITVGERPTRIIGVVLTLVAMGVAPESAAFVGSWGPVLVAVVTLVGWAQLAIAIARW